MELKKIISFGVFLGIFFFIISNYKSVLAQYNCYQPNPFTDTYTTGSCTLTIKHLGWDNTDGSIGGYRNLSNGSTYRQIGLNDSNTDCKDHENLDFTNSWGGSNGRNFSIRTLNNTKDADHSLGAGWQLNSSGCTINDCSATQIGPTQTATDTPADTTRSYTLYFCGDGQCTCGENNSSCPSDCTVPIPNCKDINGPTNIITGSTYSYSAAYENYNGTLTTAGMVVVQQGSCNPYILNGMQNGGQNTYSFNWTPATAGNYTMFCRAWNDGIAECRGTCVDKPPRYSCPGPDTTINITVVDPTPTPLPCSSTYNHTCGVNGVNSVRFSWASIVGANNHLLRLNHEPWSDWKTDAAGDQTDYTANDYIDMNITPGANYIWDMQPIKPGETYPYGGCRNPFELFACPTPTPPTCSVSLDSPGNNDCVKYASLSASVGGNADQVGYSIAGCVSGWLDAGSTYSTNDCAGTSGRTGTFNWTATAHSSTDACQDATSNPRSIRLDNSPPPSPNITCSINTSTQRVTFNWNPVSDVGCFGGVSYWLQVWDNATPNNWYTNGWVNNGPYVVNDAEIGRTYTAKALSSDIGGNQSPFAQRSCTYCDPATPTGLTTDKNCVGGLVDDTITFNWNSMPNAINYQIQIYDSQGHWCKNEATSNQTSYVLNPATCANTMVTGPVTWRVAAIYPGACAWGPWATGTFNYSSPVPTNRTMTTVPDTSNPNCTKYLVKYSWTPPAAGCDGFNANDYWSQISTSNSFNPDGSFISVPDWHNDWINETSRTSSPPAGLFVAGTVYGHVRSRDSSGNPSAWSKPSDSVAIPLPTPYPTIHIQGNYIEDTGIDSPNCAGGLNINPPTQLTINNFNGQATTTCTKGVNSYSCDVRFNNQANPCMERNQTLTFSGSYDSYNLNWRTGTPGDCAGGTESAIPIDLSSVAPTPIQKNIFFKVPEPWFKISNGAFNSRTSRANIIPYNMQRFDDIDDTTDKYLIVNRPGSIINQTGSILSPGNINIGLSATTGIYSTPNWKYFSYTSNNPFGVTRYLEYVKSRKEYQTIDDLNRLDPTKVNVWGGSLPLEIDPSQAAKFNGVANTSIVLIVNGDVAFDINSGKFTPNRSVAIVAQTINFYKDSKFIDEANGLFIANSINLGNSNKSLKIKGNLNSLSSSLNNTRKLVDNSKPSIFIVFDPKLYLDLLPYLSIAKYDWKQLQ